jgi:hypothetical protein
MALVAVVVGVPGVAVVEVATVFDEGFELADTFEALEWIYASFEDCLWGWGCWSWGCGEGVRAGAYPPWNLGAVYALELLVAAAATPLPLGREEPAPDDPPAAGLYWDH